VALFLRARASGLAQVELHPIQLSTNFRSQAGIVAWVNRHFTNILPKAEDPDEGAVPYTASDAHHAEEAGLAVQWHPFLGTDPAIAREREAARVVEVVRQALLDDPAQSI